MPRGLGVGSLLHTLILYSRAMTSVDAGGPELPQLDSCNFFEVMLKCLRWSGGLWRMRVFEQGEIGVGSIFFCIITSLASRDVTVVPMFMVVVWVDTGVTSSVRSMVPEVSGVCSILLVWMLPVC